MRIPLFTSPKSTILFSILCLCFFSVIGSIFALQSQPSDQSEGHEPEKLYTKAREQEEKMAAQYVGDSMNGFSKKLDKAVKKDPELKRFFGKGYCDGCDSIVSPDLDQTLIDYLGTVPPLTKNVAYDFASIVQPHLDPRISEVSMTDIRGFNTLMNIMTDSIMGQVGEQMVLSRDIAPMGISYDGDPNNGTRDLMVDLQEIDKKLFEIPESGPYINESKQQIASLISGKEGPLGTWGDVTGTDIASALGIASSSPVRGVASVCAGGVCNRPTNNVGSSKGVNINTVKPLTGKSLEFKPQGSGDTLESIFGSGTDFMTKYGANRPNPCKIPPTWFFFQGLFDQNASSDHSDSGGLLAEMFSQGVYPVQEVPELLKGFMNRESRTRESEDKQIDDSIARAFKMSGMNSQQPEAILIAGAERRTQAAARAATDKNLPASASVNALGYADVAYDKYIESLGKPMKGAFIKDQARDSARHLVPAFKEMQARSNSMNEYAKTFGTIAEYLNSKGDCLQS